MATKDINPATPDNTRTAGKEETISLPQNDRPEGPFEHSGETAGWTKEEKEEMEEQRQGDA